MRDSWFVRHRMFFLRIFARSFVAVSALLVLGFVARAALDLYAAAVYKPARAEIVEAEARDAEVMRNTQSDPHRKPTAPRSTTVIVTHDPRITFRYTVEGRTYERTGFSTFGTTLSATLSPAAVREKYAVGSTQTCWYDPSDPSKAVLEFGVSPYYAFAFFALILLIVARTIAAHVLSS